MRETQPHTLLHVVLMNVLGNRSKRCRQHLAEPAAKLERSRRDSALKATSQIVVQTSAIFLLKLKGRGQGSTQHWNESKFSFVIDFAVFLT